MHICIDVSPTAQKHAGLGRYAGEIARMLADDPAVNLSLFYNRDGDATLPNYLSDVPYKTVNIGNKPWRMGVFASQMTHWPMDKTFGASDIFHATNHLLAHFGRARTVYTLHDLIFLRYPEHHKNYNRWYLTLTMPHYLKAADVIITPSECSKQDALEYYRLPEQKIKVIYEAAAPHFKPTPDPNAIQRVRHKYKVPDKFILHVATIEPRKNLIRLLDALAQLRQRGCPARLVLVGPNGWLVNGSLEQEIETLGMKDAVQNLGYVPLEDLPGIYSLATVFAFPSLYEGFGLPPLEEIQCGCPVIVSDRASMREVVGPAGRQLPP
ncbi:MAG: glycosyltransferase family 4 protein, partial [Caldilineaceae bacterium]|nr:glycosyltransferase family 4 protein [Caldilineaceae bacterium]